MQTDLGNAVGVAFNLYEFLSSHSALVSGTIPSDVSKLGRTDDDKDAKSEPEWLLGGVLSKETLDQVRL